MSRIVKDCPDKYVIESNFRSSPISFLQIKVMRANELIVAIASRKAKYMFSMFFVKDRLGLGVGARESVKENHNKNRL